MAVPTVTVNEISQGIQDYSSNGSVKKVLEGILNDYMDLQYAKETPYTTGQQILPTGSTIEDVQTSIQSNTEKKFNDIFVTISDIYKSGDLTPKSKNDGTWDPKLKPVLVCVTPNK
ncbi:uncharacterized protein LOC121737004 [Aricia agestis]|uniref:uncharacterized protein LOC121737004 n=1 Tax=Aricia agestis TaxID=91739 RepID=UPI001C20B1CE|nr:uncharacterized protein LOC121737004 [Aricia agestis]XP_041984442.1 uncharacterized protein LOC121737004 [Aricia agestis]